LTGDSHTQDRRPAWNTTAGDRHEEQMNSLLLPKSFHRLSACGAKWVGLVGRCRHCGLGREPVFAEPPDNIPDLASSSTHAWTPLTARGTIARYGTGWFDPPPACGGQSSSIPTIRFGGNDTGRPTPAIGNYKDPILKPWAAEQCDFERGTAGRQDGDPVPGSVALLAGRRAGQLLWTTSRCNFIQSPKQVMIVWQRDQWWRDHHDRQASGIYQAVRYGESIGRYENGELVIHTIGIAAKKNSYLDMFRTPQPTSCGWWNASSHPRQQILKPSSRSRTKTRSTNPCTWQSAWRKEPMFGTIDRAENVAPILDAHFVPYRKPTSRI